MNEKEAYDLPCSVDAAIDKAAEHLPPGWEIKLSIERNGYDLYLRAPDGSEIDNISGDNGLISDIDEAIRIANGVVEK